MAAMFTNHTLFLASVPPTASTSTPSRTRPCRLRPSRRLSWSTRSWEDGGNRSFTEVPRSPVSRRISFRASVKVAESDPETVDEERRELHTNVPKENTEELLTMKALIEAYKEAVINGDEKVVSEIESAICAIEKQKNDLYDEVEEKSSEITLEKQRFLRYNADFANFRRSTEKDRLKFKGDIQGDLIESLLPMVDEFEKAMQQTKPETEKEKKIDTSYHGIYKQFVETLRASHVAVIPTVGEKFDPSVHEAVARVESKQFREGIVTQEVRRGFLLGDRVVRPAMVKVSSGPGIKNKQPSVEESTAAAVADQVNGPVSTDENS